MITSRTMIRIRYNEVDKMGYVYHGNYAKYYHIGRTELLRELGLSDEKLERSNIILPVVEMCSKFIKPVFYDDNIMIKTSLIEIPRSRIKFIHNVYNQENEIVNSGSATLAFVAKNSRKAIKVPELISKKIDLFINLVKQ